ncbi:MAG: vanadium-dependent haloperoxidase [Bacteroidota bacterium]
MRCICLLLILVGCTPAICQTLSDTDEIPLPSTELILDINEFTYTLANQHDQFYSFIGVRALSMVHLAVHDILNSIYPQFEAYHFREEADEVDLSAAIISATQSLLTAAYPRRIDTIHQVCTSWSKGLLAGELHNRGIFLGKKVAESYIQLRKGDGHEKKGDYTPMTKPGDYQYTPGFDWVWKPDFSVARPFTLNSITQFRSPKPPALKGQEYAEAYNEVKTYGEKGSAIRSKDETHYAHWWAEFGEHGWNRIGRITAQSQGLKAVEANRMFALLNMNLYDLYLVSFESKYFYDTWRPVTAIRNGASDGNPLTEGDNTWEPEMQTPPWPDYPSTHAAVGASGAVIVSHVFGTHKVPFAMESVTALPEAKVRSYEDLELAAEHCALSRIMNGFHFRFATDKGVEQGRVLARHTVGNFLRKVP